MYTLFPFEKYGKPSMEKINAARPPSAFSLSAPPPMVNARSPFVRVGLPLLGFMVFGTLGLSQFMRGKMETQDKMYQNKSQREYDVETEYKSMMRKLAPQMENYENKPVPRPDGE